MARHQPSIVEKSAGTCAACGADLSGKWKVNVDDPYVWACQEIECIEEATEISLGGVNVAPKSENQS